MPSLRQSFDAVVDLPPEARRDWMDRHCTDPTDRHHLEALLAAHARTEPLLLDTPVAAVIDAMKGEDARPTQAWIGERIGAFRLMSAPRPGRHGERVPRRTRRRRLPVNAWR